MRTYQEWTSYLRDKVNRNVISSRDYNEFTHVWKSSLDRGELEKHARKNALSTLPKEAMTDSASKSEEGNSMDFSPFSNPIQKPYAEDLKEDKNEGQHLLIGDEEGVKDILEDACELILKIVSFEKDEQSALKDVIVNKKKIDDREMLKNLDLKLDAAIHDIEEQVEPQVTGPGGHVPDMTGPHGRGMGPGEGKGEGLGIEKAKQKETVQSFWLNAIGRKKF